MPTPDEDVNPKTLNTESSQGEAPSEGEVDIVNGDSSFNPLSVVEGFEHHPQLSSQATEPVNPRNSEGGAVAEMPDADRAPKEPSSQAQAAPSSSSYSGSAGQEVMILPKINWVNSEQSFEACYSLFVLFGLKSNQHNNLEDFERNLRVISYVIQHKEFSVDKLDANFYENAETKESVSQTFRYAYKERQKTSNYQYSKEKGVSESEMQEFNKVIERFNQYLVRNKISYQVLFNAIAMKPIRWQGQVQYSITANMMYYINGLGYYLAEDHRGEESRIWRNPFFPAAYQPNSSSVMGGNSAFTLPPSDSGLLSCSRMGGARSYSVLNGTGDPQQSGFTLRQSSSGQRSFFVPPRGEFYPSIPLMWNGYLPPSLVLPPQMPNKAPVVGVSAMEVDVTKADGKSAPIAQEVLFQLPLIKVKEPTSQMDACINFTLTLLSCGDLVRKSKKSEIDTTLVESVIEDFFNLSKCNNEEDIRKLIDVDDYDARTNKKTDILYDSFGKKPADGEIKALNKSLEKLNAEIEKSGLSETQIIIWLGEVINKRFSETKKECLLIAGRLSNFLEIVVNEYVVGSTEKDKEKLCLLAAEKDKAEVERAVAQEARELDAWRLKNANPEQKMQKNKSFSFSEMNAESSNSSAEEDSRPMDESPAEVDFQPKVPSSKKNNPLTKQFRKSHASDARDDEASLTPATKIARKEYVFQLPEIIASESRMKFQALIYLDVLLMFCQYHYSKNLLPRVTPETIKKDCERLRTCQDEKSFANKEKWSDTFQHYYDIFRKDRLQKDIEKVHPDKWKDADSKAIEKKAKKINEYIQEINKKIADKKLSNEDLMDWLGSIVAHEEKLMGKNSSTELIDRLSEFLKRLSEKHEIGVNPINSDVTKSSTRRKDQKKTLEEQPQKQTKSKSLKKGKQPKKRNPRKTEVDYVSSEEESSSSEGKDDRPLKLKKDSDQPVDFLEIWENHLRLLREQQQWMMGATSGVLMDPQQQSFFSLTQMNLEQGCFVPPMPVTSEVAAARLTTFPANLGMVPSILNHEREEGSSSFSSSSQTSASVPVVVPVQELSTYPLIVSLAAWVKWVSVISNVSEEKDKLQAYMEASQVLFLIQNGITQGGEEVDGKFCIEIDSSISKIVDFKGFFDIVKDDHRKEEEKNKLYAAKLKAAGIIVPEIKEDPKPLIVAVEKLTSLPRIKEAKALLDATSSLICDTVLEQRKGSGIDYLVEAFEMLANTISKKIEEQSPPKTTLSEAVRFKYGLPPASNSHGRD